MLLSLDLLGRKRARTILAAGALVIAALWAAGLCVFSLRKNVLSFAFPTLAPHPGELHNLALYRYGTHVSASSYDNWSDSQHHPGFLVDGLRSETVDQKWATRNDDENPWVALRWKVPASLERVTIRHAGVNEHKGYTARNYRITCLTREGKGPTVKVSNNEQSEVSHDLQCKHAMGVKLYFRPNGPKDVVRVFEVEAWGTVNTP